MKNAGQSCIILCAALLLPAADARCDAEAAAAALPAKTAAAGQAAGLDAFWQGLFRKLADQGCVKARFVEFRWFPFRKLPVQLKGEMRFSRERGLSLHYLEPEERIVVADHAGLLMRTPGGSTRSLPADPKRPETGSALLNVLRFDQEELARAFELTPSRMGLAWRIDLVARDERARRALGTISVSGEDNTVRKLEFRQAERQRIEIFIEEPRHGVTFTAEEAGRFFR